MSKPLLSLHFHADERFGPILESARATARDERLRKAAPFDSPPEGTRVFGALHRFADGLGAPVLVSISNERLLRAFDDASERKALGNGTSRRRLLTVPTLAFSADPRLFAAFEVADEVRLNLDLLKRALITPPLAEPPSGDARHVVYAADPAATIADLPLHAKEVVIGIDLGSIERGGDVDGAFARLLDAILGRNDLRVKTPVAGPPGFGDRFLQDLLASGGRYPRFAAGSEDDVDVTRDIFPFDLIVKSLADAAAPRTIAAHGNAILESGFDLEKLDPKLARGLLLRRLARAAVPDGTDPIERARAAFLIAGVLLERCVADESVPDAAITLAGSMAPIPDLLRRLLERTDGSAPKKVEQRVAAFETVTSAPTGKAAAKSLLDTVANGLDILESWAAARHENCVTG